MAETFVEVNVLFPVLVMSVENASTLLGYSVSSELDDVCAESAA